MIDKDAVIKVPLGSPGLRSGPRNRAESVPETWPTPTNTSSGFYREAGGVVVNMEGLRLSSGEGIRRC